MSVVKIARVALLPLALAALLGASTLGCGSSNSTSHLVDRDPAGVGTPTADDVDGDGVVNIYDNCPDAANYFQANSDNHGQVAHPIATDCNGDGDMADLHEEAGGTCTGDTFGDACDNCPNATNETQDDDDNDGIGTVCDNCPYTANADQHDANHDSIGDACQP